MADEVTPGEPAVNDSHGTYRDGHNVHFGAQVSVASDTVMMMNEVGSGTTDSSADNNTVTEGPSNVGPRPDDEDTHLSHIDMLIAIALVTDAKDGRNISFAKEEKCVKAYMLYNQWYLKYSLYFLMVFNMSLAFFEKPALGGWKAPFWATIILEICCLAFFSFRIAHARQFDRSEKFWKDRKNIVVVVLIVMTLIDMVCYIIWASVTTEDNAIRWSRPFRPLFIINFPDGRQIRRAFRNIRRTLPEIINVLILFLLSVALFSLLALKLFSKRSHIKYLNGADYFKNYFDSMWDLYVLVTTANNPDVMMPAYDSNYWFALFFVIYLIICLYIFMSIVLAVIYSNYKKNLKNEIQIAVYGKRRKLGEAFGILRLWKGNRYVISQDRWYQVIKGIDAKRSDTEIELLLSVLDLNGDGCIERHEFLKLADLLQLPLTEVKDRMTLIERVIPNFYNSRFSTLTKAIVRHKIFRYFFDLLIVMNALFIGLNLDEADWFFLTVFTMEILLKLYTFGPMEFFKRFWNVFDFFVIGAALMLSIVEAGLGATTQEFSTLDVLLVLRVMRLIKIFGSIKRFKVMIVTIVNIVPALLTYGGVIFVFYYIFAIIGMEIFHNKIHGYRTNSSGLAQDFCGNPKLKDSEFFRVRYCNNNFNNIVNSFVVLFELCVVNQWHVLSSGFVIVTNKAARLYFFAFHLTCVVIILNIFVAFILEAFLLEYSLSKSGHLISTLEKKIKEMGLSIKPAKSMSKKADKNDLVGHEELPDIQDVHDDDSDNESIPDLSQEQGLRFHLRKKSRKKVEVLLQQMFEGEIDSEDEGPAKDLEDISPDDRTPRKYTFDTVT